MKKKLSFVIMAVILISVAAGSLDLNVNAGKFNTKSEEVYYEFGTIEREKLDSADDSPVLQAKSFTVFAKELLAVTKEELSGLSEEDAEASAEKTLVEKYTMYNVALANGIVPDEEGTRKDLEYNREISKTAENYSDFQSFLDGIGMTHDEYWDSQYDNMLMYDTILRYKDQLKEEFSQQGTYSDENELDASWDTYYEKIVEEAVREEDVHPADGTQTAES